MGTHSIVEGTGFQVKTSRILRPIQFDSGFHFYTSRRHYIGITAVSLPEFAEKLKTVDARSVRFHFERHDFRKWIGETVGDDQLVKRINQLNTQLSAENLRRDILDIIRKRIAELDNFRYIPRLNVTV